MVKEAPSLGRIIAMVAFTLSVFGLLMFLWLAFGGPIPLKPESYRFKVRVPEAPTLAQEADVRIAGVNVGKIKKKELDKGGSRTIVEVELKDQYAPIPKDSRAMLREKTLLGETYMQIAPGHKSAGMVKDGGFLANSRVQRAVQLDEIFSAFDKPTRDAFQEWIRELAKASGGNSSQDLNDALGNLAPFAVDGAKLLKVLDDQNIAVRQLVKNTGRTFAAINQRQGALRQLIVNSGNTFQATASKDEALAQTFEVFPTFLDESKATLARLERFSNNTRPLVNDLKGPADDLGPTVRDLGDLAPHLTRLFRNLKPLTKASEKGVPALTKVLNGAQPLLEAAHVFFPELNPILSYFNFRQNTIAGFLSNGGADLSAFWGGTDRGQEQVGLIDGRSFEPHYTPPCPGGVPASQCGRPDYERGNAYIAPNALNRGIALGITESFDCKPTGGNKVNPVDNAPTIPGSGPSKQPPCLVQPPSLYDGKFFNQILKGKAPKVDAPKNREGRTPAVDPNPNDPAN
jgi:phospholipid/cholesterol/gamma-HCH transport system substrate-binding protein